jgi:hypothetical protein
MRHILAIIAALILLGFAGVVVWYNRTALTTPILCFVGGSIAIAFALAIPADFKQAASTVATYIPVTRGGNPPTP